VSRVRASWESVQAVPRFLPGFGMTMAEMSTDSPRVLVVDDEPNIVDVITMALRYQGFEAASAATGQEALAAVESFRPQVVAARVVRDHDAPAQGQLLGQVVVQPPDRGGQDGLLVVDRNDHVDGGRRRDDREGRGRKRCGGVHGGHLPCGPQEEAVAGLRVG
jgi:CheY-like chemotaxis protein